MVSMKTYNILIWFDLDEFDKVYDGNIYNSQQKLSISDMDIDESLKDSCNQSFENSSIFKEKQKSVSNIDCGSINKVDQHSLLLMSSIDIIINFIKEFHFRWKGNF